MRRTLRKNDGTPGVVVLRDATRHISSHIIYIYILNQVLVEDLALPLLPHDQLHIDPSDRKQGAHFTTPPLNTKTHLSILPKTKLLVRQIPIPLTCRWGRESTLRGGGKELPEGTFLTRRT